MKKIGSKKKLKNVSDKGNAEKVIKIQDKVRKAFLALGESFLLRQRATLAESQKLYMYMKEKDYPQMWYHIHHV